MQAEPAPPNAAFFQRSGSTAKCWNRSRSVDGPWAVIRLVSGYIAKRRNGSAACDLRKKYCTCEPGVSRPSGMMGEHSFVTVVPSQPVRDCGTVESHVGTVPSQRTFWNVPVLVAAFVVSWMKQRNLFTPSVANLGSNSLYMAM